MIKQVPSPNFSKSKVNNSILVIHATASDNGSGGLAWMTNPASKVSAHYMVDRDGTTYQLVDEANMAWHAGKSEWRGLSNINLYSIGIEVVCAPTSGYPKVQLDALIALCNDIIARNKITKDNVVRHADIAPGRKHDPYPQFPWALFTSSLTFPMSEAGSTISPWAMSSVAKARAKGYECKDPQGTITQEQLAVVLDRLGLFD